MVTIMEAGSEILSWAPAGNARPGSRPPCGDRLADAAPNQRRALLVEQIRRDTGRVLGLQNLESLPNNKSLGELGLDSLMAVELRNALASTAGESLPATLLFDYPTVDTLTDYLSRRVLGLEELAEAPTERQSTGSARLGSAWTRSRTLMTTKLSVCSNRKKRQSSE